MLFKGMDNNIDFGELELFTRNETEKKRYELFKKYKNLQRKIQARTDLSDLKKQQELMKNQERLASDLSELPRPVIFADEQPTTTEIKQYLVTDQLKETFRRLVGSFAEIDKGIDKDELIENTEQFLKEKAVYCTMMESAQQVGILRLHLVSIQI